MELNEMQEYLETTTETVTIDELVKDRPTEKLLNSRFASTKASFHAEKCSKVTKQRRSSLPPIRFNAAFQHSRDDRNNNYNERFAKTQRLSLELLPKLQDCTAGENGARGEDRTESRVGRRPTPFKSDMKYHIEKWSKDVMASINEDGGHHHFPNNSKQTQQMKLQNGTEDKLLPKRLVRCATDVVQHDYRYKADHNNKAINRKATSVPEENTGRRLPQHPKLHKVRSESAIQFLKQDMRETKCQTRPYSSLDMDFLRKPKFIINKDQKQ
eukprot:gene17271-18997_t